MTPESLRSMCSNACQYEDPRDWCVTCLAAAALAARDAEIALYKKKAHDWNAEADTYLAQRDELTVALAACQREKDAALADATFWRESRSELYRQWVSRPSTREDGL